MFAFFSGNPSIGRMKLFSRVSTSLLLSIFCLFLAGPIFAIWEENQNTIILSTNFSDTCNWNIQCEPTPDWQYVCSSSTESLSGQGWSIHHIPVGKYGTDIIATRITIFQYIPERVIQEKKITYVWPDTYIYPFVGILKIQV